MKIQYLTWLHEKTGKHEDNILLPTNVKNIENLINYLEINKPECAVVFKNRHTIYTAVNNEIQPAEFEITNADNISFFSAIVGG
jgi:molybdopterin converting factor small subunit